MKDLIPVLSQPDIMERFKKNPQEVQKTNPQGYEKIMCLNYLYQQLRGKTQKQGQRLIAQHLSLTAGNKISPAHVYEEFHSAIKASKEFIAGLIREFVPDIFRFPFTSDGVSMPTSDPLELLKIMWNPPGNPAYTLLRSFEASLFWQLGMRYLIMRLVNQPLESQLRELTLWLEEQFFNANNSIGRAGVVTSYYDPKNLNRFTKKNTGREINQIVSYRFIQTKDETIRVLYEGRIKNESDIFRKSLLKSRAENPIASDYCAISIVFFSDKDYQKARDSLRNQIITNGAAIADLCFNGEGSKGVNHYSSHKFHPKEQFFAFVRGGWIEFQIFLYPNYFNRKFSLGEENHHLYRLSQVLPLLKLFFPAELYLISWNKKTYARLQALQIARIKASYEEI